MKKLIAVFIILFVLQLAAGLALYIHSEVEYIKIGRATCRERVFITV